MGLFDRFKAGGGKKAEDRARPKGSPAARWADRVEKRAQNYDRQEAIEALSEMGTAEAAEILLRRFTFIIDPSITDQEEKEAAFRGVLKAGNAAIEPVRAFAARAESLAWPMKVLKELVGEAELVEELLRWLSRWDTEYSKFIDPKLQILTALEDHRHPEIVGGVERFLGDVNEAVRFHAVAALLAQDDERVIGPIADLVAGEESTRVKAKVADGLAARGWAIPEDRRDTVRRALPAGYSMDAAGRVIKRP
jgi:HEAT repeat protein